MLNKEQGILNDELMPLTKNLHIFTSINIEQGTRNDE